MDDMMTRIVVGVGSGILLLGYLAWRWKRAGDYVAAEQAHRDDALRYFEALKSDPRWHALQALIQQRYPISFVEGDPATFVVQYAALVDDQGFTHRLDNPIGPTRVTALLVRKQPATQLYVSMDLRTGEPREDAAPYGWTYIGPPR